MDIGLYSSAVILFDAENVGHTCIENVIQLADYRGQILICRAYGDWAMMSLSNWCRVADSLCIERIQVDQIGKDAADGRIIVDIGRILGDDELVGLSTFIIISGDGHYASTVKYLQDEGMTVIGIGDNKDNTSCDLEDSCDLFYYSNQLETELQNLRRQHPLPPTDVRDFFHKVDFVYKIIQRKHDCDWVSLTDLGREIRKITPDYDSRFGNYSLSTWISTLAQIYEYADQKIRKIDPTPYKTRYMMLNDAFFQCTTFYGQVSCKKLEEALHERAGRRFDRYFHGKTLMDWLAEYERYVVENNMVRLTTDPHKSLYDPDMRPDRDFMFINI